VAAEVSVSINGEMTPVELTRGYLHLDRLWSDGDSVQLTLPMRAKALRAHPKVRQDVGRVALSRGPLIYCLEQVDNGAGLNAIIIGDALSVLDTAPLPTLVGSVGVSITAILDDAK